MKRRIQYIVVEGRHSIILTKTIERQPRYNFVYICQQTGNEIAREVYHDGLRWWPIPANKWNGWLMSPANALRFEENLRQLSGDYLRKEFMQITSNIGDLIR